MSRSRAQASAARALLTLALLTAPAATAAAASPYLAARDGHGHGGHGHHAEPLLELNETEVTMYHAPVPESYFTLDFDGIDPDNTHYPWLMVLHGLLMSLAFFVALPIGMSSSIEALAPVACTDRDRRCTTSAVAYIIASC
jgi:hypothetical protein